jgi:hypothetical protein
MTKNKENKSEFVIIRVTVVEKLELIKKALDSKNLSRYIRHLLHLSDE